MDCRKTESCDFPSQEVKLQKYDFGNNRHLRLARGRKKISAWDFSAHRVVCCAHWINATSQQHVDPYYYQLKSSSRGVLTGAGCGCSHLPSAEKGSVDIEMNRWTNCGQRRNTLHESLAVFRHTVTYAGMERKQRGCGLKHAGRERVRFLQVLRVWGGFKCCWCGAGARKIFYSAQKSINSRVGVHYHFAISGHINLFSWSTAASEFKVFLFFALFLFYFHTLNLACFSMRVWLFFY